MSYVLKDIAQQLSKAIDHLSKLPSYIYWYKQEEEIKNDFFKLEFYQRLIWHVNVNMKKIFNSHSRFILYCLRQIFTPWGLGEYKQHFLKNYYYLLQLYWSVSLLLQLYVDIGHAGAEHVQPFCDDSILWPQP